MKKKAVSLLSRAILVLLLITATAVAAPRQMRLYAGDAGKSFQLEQDTVAVIELDSQPSTGLGWRAGHDLKGGLKILGTGHQRTQLVGIHKKGNAFRVQSGHDEGAFEQ